MSEPDVLPEVLNIFVLIFVSKWPKTEWYTMQTVQIALLVMSVFYVIVFFIHKIEDYGHTADNVLQCR